MPIQKGCPIVFQEIADLVNANYPEYAFLLTPDAKGQPIKVDLSSPPAYQGCALLAMLTPPNVTIRPASIGNFDLFFITPVSGIDPEMAPGQPVRAANIFEEYTTVPYPGATDTQSINDVNTFLAAYKVAHPNYLVLGMLTSYYSNLIDDENMAIGQIASKQIAP